MDVSRFTRPVASTLEFHLDHPEYGTVEPGELAEWRATVDVDKWALADPEIVAICAAGERRGGIFAFPAASDALMEAYSMMETRPDAAVRMLERRVAAGPRGARRVGDARAAAP